MLAFSAQEPCLPPRQGCCKAPTFLLVQHTLTYNGSDAYVPHEAMDADSGSRARSCEAATAIYAHISHILSLGMHHRTGYRALLHPP